MTVTREETIETAKAVETAGTGNDGEKSKSEYPKNLARVPCIQYSITF